MKIKPGYLYHGATDGEFGHGFFVPVLNKHGILHLVDTAVLERPTKKYDAPTTTDAGILRAIELGETDNSNILRNVSTSYFLGAGYIHSAGVDGEISEQQFQEVGDLRDFRALDGAEVEWFDPNDVITHVRLWRDHGYSWARGGNVGVTLVRKDAQPVAWRKLKDELDSQTAKQRSPHSYIGNVDHFYEDASQTGDIPEEVEFRYRQFKARHKFLLGLQRQYSEFLQAERDAYAEFDANQQVRG